MRLPSASDFAEKGDKRRKWGGHKTNLPRQGSKLRATYDRLTANPGIPISIDDIVPGPSRDRANQIRQLVDFYGLDIRLWRRASFDRDESTLWLLAGEWNGKEYTDYTQKI